LYQEHAGIARCTIFFNIITLLGILVALSAPTVLVWFTPQSEHLSRKFFLFEITALWFKQFHVALVSVFLV
jgi:hypothetical protein